MRLALACCLIYLLSPGQSSHVDGRQEPRAVVCWHAPGVCVQLSFSSSCHGGFVFLTFVTAVGMGHNLRFCRGRVVPIFEACCAFEQSALEFGR